MSLSELRLRAASGDTLADRDVCLVGQVTAPLAGGFVLTRWVPGCCSAEDAVDVHVRAEGEAVVGSWLEVDGRWVEGTGTAHGQTPALTATAARPVTEPPPRREDLG
jgi:hypothetical protein